MATEKAEEKPQSDVERLYVGNEPKEISVLGVKLKLREITGEEFLDLSKECMTPDGKTVNPEKYIPKLINAVVIEPKIDVSRLTVKAYTMIGDEIQKELGLMDIVPKNL